MNRKTIIAVAQSALVVVLGISQLHDAGLLLAQAVRPVSARAVGVLASLRAPQAVVPVLHASLPAPVIAALPSACTRRASPPPAPPRAPIFETNVAPVIEQIAQQQAMQLRTQRTVERMSQQVTEAPIRAIVAQTRRTHTIIVRQLPVPSATPVL
jgi:hypothetical protein